MNRGLLVLIIAAVCGVGAMFGARQFLIPRPAPAEEQVQVVVAAQELKQGTWLDTKGKDGKPVIALLPWPKAQVRPGMFVKGQADLATLTDPRGRRWIRVPVGQETPLTESMLGPPESKPGLAYLLNGPDNRAVTIRVDVESGVAGFINPEDHVDIVATYPDSQTAKILLQDVRVLAAGEFLQPDPTKPNLNVTSMTFELSPSDSTKLRLATGRRGRLSLLLRGPNTDDIPVDQQEMIFGESVEEREALRRQYDDMEKKLNLLLAERQVEEKPTETRLASQPVAPAPQPAPVKPAVVSTPTRPGRSTTVIAGLRSVKRFEGANETTKSAPNANGTNPDEANPDDSVNPALINPALINPTPPPAPSNNGQGAQPNGVPTAYAGQ